MSHYGRYRQCKPSGVEWIGQIPSHWTVAPLKTVAAVVNGATPDSTNADYWDGDTAWYTPADIDNEVPTILGEPRRRITSKGLDSCAAALCPPATVILSTRAPIGSVGITACSAATNQGCRSLVPARNFPERWLANVLVASRRELALRGNGTTFQELSTEALRSLRIPVPPADERVTMVAALDRETAHIDALIAKKTEFIDLLNKKRLALITHAVTKGLDAKAKMRPSGIAWIGDVPKHWNVLQLGKLASQRCDGPFGSGLKSEHYQSDGVRVIRLQNIGWAQFRNDNAAHISHAHWLEVLGGGHDVMPNDVLIAGLGDENNPLGRACVAPSGLGDALVKADCYRFRLKTDKASPSFVALSLSAAARAECGFLATGATRDRLNLGLACARIVALPPLAEQAAIVAFIEKAASRIDLLLTKTQQSIDLLKQRRSALVTAAVTGQIDLREPT